MTTGSIIDTLLERLTSEEWGILERTDFVMDAKYNLAQQFGDMNMVASPVLIADGSYIEDWTTAGEIDGGVTVDLVTGTITASDIGQYLVGIKMSMDVEMNHDYVLTVEFGNGESMVIEEGMGIQMDIITMAGVGMRITITYDGLKQGVLVTADLLFGVEVLDTNLGAVLIGRHQSGFISVAPVSASSILGVPLERHHNYPQWCVHHNK